MEIQGKWALILGASSGFGEACARALAARGMHIAGIHLDRKATMGHVENLIGELQGHGVQVRYFNVNAADAENRATVVQELRSETDEKPVHILMHSLAFGTLKSFVAPEAKQQISQKQMEMTLDVMANSLVYWVQDLIQHKLLGGGSKVFAMTSAGGHRVWPTYGAVSAAKAALESHVRQLALECAPMGIAVNALQAGVTDTPALRMIPGNEEMREFATRKNPHGRLTETRDIAEAVIRFAQMPSSWMTGNVIRVDGGEDLIG